MTPCRLERRRAEGEKNVEREKQKENGNPSPSTRVLYCNSDFNGRQEDGERGVQEAKIVHSKESSFSNDVYSFCDNVNYFSFPLAFDVALRWLNYKKHVLVKNLGAVAEMVLHDSCFQPRFTALPDLLHDDQIEDLDKFYGEWDDNKKHFGSEVRKASVSDKEDESIDLDIKRMTILSEASDTIIQVLAKSRCEILNVWMSRGVLDCLNAWKIYIAKRMKIKRGIQFLTRSQPGKNARASAEGCPSMTRSATCKVALNPSSCENNPVMSLTDCQLSRRWTGLLLFETFLFWKESESEVNEARGRRFLSPDKVAVLLLEELQRVNQGSGRERQGGRDRMRGGEERSRGKDNKNGKKQKQGQELSQEM
eukprot:768013-Hanusia_phi.AAC.7